jgi:hypothetical protein
MRSPCPCARAALRARATATSGGGSVEKIEGVGIELGISEKSPLELNRGLSLDMSKDCFT